MTFKALYQPPSASQPGVTRHLNLAVCPSAACSPNSGAKVPHAPALWAARPAAGSA